VQVDAKENEPTSLTGSGGRGLWHKAGNLGWDQIMESHKYQAKQLRLH
jgi:hypothetical protein